MVCCTILLDSFVFTPTQFPLSALGSAQPSLLAGLSDHNHDDHNHDDDIHADHHSFMERAPVQN